MKRGATKGFSLIELMVVVTIIGILALLGVPGLTKATQRTAAIATANDVRVFTDAVKVYSVSTGQYPVTMTYTSIPAEIEGYIPTAWTDGDYSWFYINSSYYTYLYVYNLRFTAEQAIELDKIMDDGNIGTGEMRVAFNGSGLVYLFELNI